MRDRLIGRAVGVVALLAGAGVAEAHPHVFVDAKAEVVFGDDGRITGVRHIWQFDEAFTAYAVQGLDANNDYKLDDQELAPLAKTNVESLAEFGYFTFLTVNGSQAPFAAPTEYWLDFHGGKLTLFYTLPLAQPVKPGRSTLLEVYDPEFFVDFAFVPDQPVTLAGGSGSRLATFKPPAAMDDATAMQLSQIPVDGQVPEELQMITQGLSNQIAITCPQ